MYFNLDLFLPSNIQAISYLPLGQLGQLESAWQKAAEFGVLAFVLVFILTGVGITIWKLGLTLTEATADSLRRQADAGERTAEAVMKIGDLTAAIHIQNEQTAIALADMAGHIRNTARAMQHVVDAVDELTPKQQVRVRAYLEKARDQLGSGD